MDRHVGIWIDHRRATIVSVRGRTATTTVLASAAEPKVRLTGGSPTAGSGIPDGMPESRRAARIARQLDRFYAAVLAGIGDAARIRVCGPGKARLELRRKIEANRALAPRLEAVEPCGKLTEAQFIAKVKEEFGVPAKRMAAGA